MSISEKHLAELQATFGERVTADPDERRIYSHDVGTMPRLIRPLVGRALADAVVQPRSEAEIVELVRWASEHRVPITPRAKATSGYGGVVPVRGGIVADLSRYRGVVALDPAALTVTARASTVWQDLERELAREGLALCLYPSSAPSSTVAGWLAQGGVGFGSYEYGRFRDNVASARVLLPTGEVRTFAGRELDLIGDAEGTTGIILEVTLGVRALREERVAAIAFPSAAALASALRDLAERRAPLWSASFLNPEMARLKAQLPPTLQHGHPVDEPRPRLPEAYVALLAAPAGRWPEVEAALQPVVAAHQGTMLPDELAQHEWEERYSIMHVKRLGPSLIPAEVVLPLSGLASALEGIGRAVRQPFVVEGMVARAPGGGYEATLLGFIPHDERTLAYNLAFGLALSVLKVAKAHGGRAYSTGLYFAGEAPHVLGRERLERLRAYKAQADPLGIMNPGKIYRPGALGGFMGLAQTFEPAVRVVANAARAPLGERLEGQGRRGVPSDVAWYAYACAQCGYCVDECDQYYGRTWESQSPRGKWYFLRQHMEGRGRMTQAWVDRFLACTTCELCNVRCPLELPIEFAWLRMREALIHRQGRMTFPPFEVMRAALEKERNIWASYARDRARWVPEDLRGRIRPQAEVGYFAGCTASFVEQDVAQGTARLLDAAGVEFTTMGDEEGCCGLPMLVSGQWDTFAEIVRHNVEGMHARGVKTVVTSCPACWLAWHTYYKDWARKLGLNHDFDVRHYSEVIAERIRQGFRFPSPVPMKVTWHDSCHMGRAGDIYEPPREVLRAIPGLELVEMEHNRECAHCCGGVLSLLENPDSAKVIGDARTREAEATGAEAIVASCPCCEVQLRVTAQKTGSELPIVDLGHITSQALGIDMPDPTHYAMEMWAVFEGMIWLMKPERMADLFEELFPSMFRAMPWLMLKIMRLAQAVPGMLALMKPLMPLMMPVLVPMLLPKVMPDMLAAVGRRVPMPPHMEEQMPELLPAAMEGLMPKMLPLITPLVVPRMIRYIREEL